MHSRFGRDFVITFACFRYCKFISTARRACFSHTRWRFCKRDFHSLRVEEGILVNFANPRRDHHTAAAGALLQLQGAGPPQVG